MPSKVLAQNGVFHRFVIKTAGEDDNKVFINVCHARQVSAPSNWSQGKVHQFNLARSPISMLMLRAIAACILCFLKRTQGPVAHLWLNEQLEKHYLIAQP